MKNIWVVTTGEYSDYHIVGMFSDKDVADRFVELQDERWGGYDVESWEVDSLIGEINKVPQGKFMWSVWMDREGCTDQYGVHKCLEKDVSILFKETYHHNLFMRVVLIASDEKAAVKICNEKRVQLIASGEWDQALKEMGEYKEGKKYGRLFEKRIL